MTTAASEVIAEHLFPSAEDLMRALDPMNSLWEDQPQEWIFRGHADADWPLLPSAHRALSWEKFCRIGDDRFDPAQVVERDRFQRERDVIHDFLGALRASGTMVPEEYTSAGESTPVGKLQPMALAQHHGIPTRLLDWTRQARTAAYFACTQSSDSATHLAVWCLRASFITGGPLATGYLKLVVASRWDNPNLHAQDGLFTFLAVTPEESTGLPAIDSVISELASGHRQLREGARPIAYPTMRKLILPRSQEGRLMQLLHRQGVAGHRLFPGLNGVSLTVSERIKFGLIPFWES